jgi:hypothetical protein
MSFCVKLSPTPAVFYSVTEGVQYDAGARASGPYLSGSTQIMRPNAHPGDAARGTHQQRLRLPWKVKSSGRLWSAEAVHCEPQTNTRHCITAAAAAATYHLAADEPRPLAAAPRSRRRPAIRSPRLRFQVTPPLSASLFILRDLLRGLSP